jgi:hypothetical protein
MENARLFLALCLDFTSSSAFLLGRREREEWQASCGMARVRGNEWAEEDDQTHAQHKGRIPLSASVIKRIRLFK